MLLQDEIFHVPQAQQYCAHNFTHWDPMITTLPGLWVMSSLAWPNRFFLFFFVVAEKGFGQVYSYYSSWQPHCGGIDTEQNIEPDFISMVGRVLMKMKETCQFIGCMHFMSNIQIDTLGLCSSHFPSWRMWSIIDIVWHITLHLPV